MGGPLTLSASRTRELMGQPSNERWNFGTQDDQADNRDNKGIHDPKVDQPDLIERLRLLRGLAADAHHPDFHVGLEQRGADLAEDLVDVGFAQPTAVAQSVDDAVEPVAQRFKPERGKLVVG